MTEFYEVRSPNDEIVWIAARETSGEHRLFVWLANEKRWYRNAALEAEFFTGDDDMQFVLVSSFDVANALSSQPAIDRRTAGWLYDALVASTSLSSGELGVRKSTARPTLDDGLAEKLVQHPGEWVLVADYPEGSNAAAVLASEIRTGKKARLAALTGYLLARTRAINDQIVVEAMRVEPETDDDSTGLPRRRQARRAR